MKVLDLDMDFFSETPAVDIPEDCEERLDEEVYGKGVFPEERARTFLEKNLGLSKKNKIPGRIVRGHNEALYFWQELIACGKLQAPFEVVHVDSHGDLGCGGWEAFEHIVKNMLQWEVKERPLHCGYLDSEGKVKKEGIGDYLLFAIAYRMISRLTYCANPYKEHDDFCWGILKDLEENYGSDSCVENTIQLLYNPDREFPFYCPQERKGYDKFLEHSIREPEVPFTIFPTYESVHYKGDFDFVVMAQSPNYTPASADFIMDVVRDYIIEI